MDVPEGVDEVLSICQGEIKDRQHWKEKGYLIRAKPSCSSACLVSSSACLTSSSFSLMVQFPTWMVISMRFFHSAVSGKRVLLFFEFLVLRLVQLALPAVRPLFYFILFYFILFCK